MNKTSVRHICEEFLIGDKFHCLVLLLCLFCFNLNGATITSTATGNWNIGSTWVGGIAPTSADHVVIETGHAITLTANATCIDLTINGTGSLLIGSYAMTIRGEGPGDTANITTTCSSELIIEDEGAKGKFVIPTSITVLKKFTLNRETGAISDHDIDLSTCAPPADSIVLVLTDGVLTMSPLGTTKLKMGNTTHGVKIKMDIACNDSSYVDGIVQRAIKGTGFYTFPVGNGGKSRRMGINQVSTVTPSVHNVQFIRALPRNYTCYNTSLPGGLYTDYYWRQTQESGGNPQRRIYYQDSDFDLDASQRAFLTLANGELASLATCPPPTSPSNEWKEPTTGVTVYDDPGYDYVQFDGANASNNEYWGFGSTSSTAILPIELASFGVECLSDQSYNLIWTTASETNNSHFLIEKTNDGENFEVVGRIDGAGNSVQKIDYSFQFSTDLLPVYFRLKQVDLDGNSVESNLVTTNCSDNIKFDFFPNPNKGTLHFVGVYKPMYLQFYSTIGQFIYAREIIPEKSEMEITELTNGTYYIRWTSNAEEKSKILVVSK